LICQRSRRLLTVFFKIVGDFSARFAYSNLPAGYGNILIQDFYYNTFTLSYVEGVAQAEFAETRATSK
jgi:hypothetical protein